jgi:hypothetical protein
MTGGRAVRKGLRGGKSWRLSKVVAVSVGMAENASARLAISVITGGRNVAVGLHRGKSWRLFNVVVSYSASRSEAAEEDLSTGRQAEKSFVM